MTSKRAPRAGSPPDRFPRPRPIPFDPTRTLSGQVRASLGDAYSDEAIKSFVEKLRYLADVRPDLCRRVFRALDNVLAGMLDELNDPACGRSVKEGGDCGSAIRIGEALETVEQIRGLLLKLAERTAR